jgi:reactive intermediate/imine deaminase
MTRTPIHTEQAPAAIGPYSQAIRNGGMVFLSGQIPLDPATGELVGGDIAQQTRRVFQNLQAVCAEAGGTLADISRLGIYLTYLGDFAAVNAVMAEFFSPPYPARSTIQVAGLPKGAAVEVDAIALLSAG